MAPTPRPLLALPAVGLGGGASEERFPGILQHSTEVLLGKAAAVDTSCRRWDFRLSFLTPCYSH